MKQTVDDTELEGTNTIDNANNGMPSFAEVHPSNKLSIKATRQASTRDSTVTRGAASGGKWGGLNLQFSHLQCRRQRQRE